METIYYQSTTDSSTDLYFHELSKGIYVFEYPVYVTRSGEYSSGPAVIRSLYSPEFSANTGGARISVEPAFGDIF